MSLLKCKSRSKYYFLSSTVITTGLPYSNPILLMRCYCIMPSLNSYYDLICNFNYKDLELKNTNIYTFLTSSNYQVYCLICIDWKTTSISMIDNWIKSISTFRISPRLSWLNSFMIFHTILPTRMVIIIYINCLTYTHLHNPCKSLSIKDNKSLIVIINNLRLLRYCYYIGNNN